MNILHILEGKGKEDLPMMRIRSHTEGKEAPHIMKEDIGEKEVTQETQKKEETIMVVVGLGGEGTAGGVSVSRGLLCRRLFSPEISCAK